MKSFSILFISLVISITTSAQFQTEKLTPLPESVSNNPVCGAVINGQRFVYSFGGIDTSKAYSGIHNRSYKYDVTNDSWTSLPELPDFETKIAAGASLVNNIIYIIGGYQVLANGNEITHNTVHRFDVTSDTFLTDGTPLPTRTDDHVQTVYKDSLIFVVTGWNTNTNIPNVQIYDPLNDIWLVGDPVPNTHLYKSFGASGSILGDTLYYFGGARFGSNFPVQREIRKGWIDPIDPTHIIWSMDTLHMDLVGYRMASTTINNKVYWIGGSNTTYNYDGIGYQGNIPVEPNNRILSYSPNTGNWDTTFSLEINMDFRGIATFSDEMFLIGGMENNQQVSSKNLRLFHEPNGIENKVQLPFKMFPNPAQQKFTIETQESNYTLEMFNLQGQLVKSAKGNKETSINIENLFPGMYWVQLSTNTSQTVLPLVIQP